MVVTITLSLFPLLSNKHWEQQFPKEVCQSALLSQSSEHLKSVIEIRMKFLTKFTLEKKFGVFIQGVFGFQSSPSEKPLRQIPNPITAGEIILGADE